MAVNYRPANTQDVIPYLMVADADKELAFLKKVFDAKELHLSRAPNGSIVHASVRVGDCVVMMAQARDPWPAQEMSLYIYVRDVDATYKRAIDAGATSIMAVADQFYGDRHGGVKSANNISYWVTTHIEDVSDAELERRTKEVFASKTHG